MPITHHRALLGTTLALALGGCARGPAVRTDGTLPLHRVVIYRNGVGYFERQGRASTDQLEFHVREGDFGDFLATLAVMEEGGSSVRAAAFSNGPRASDPANAHVSDRRTVRLSLDGRGHRIAVGYTVETPIWRPSYRLLYGSDGNVQLQLWGIVQNQSGEDWRDVRLSLVAGAPVAFRAELGNATVTARPTVTDRGEVINAVPHAESSLAQDGVDRDGDGIPDTTDRCPSSPEDRNGLADEDGCPDADRDGDSVADSNDRCPDEPETYNGSNDNDGCPDRGSVIVSEAQIRILDTIQFAPGGDSIRAASLPILDAVARTLLGNPQIARLQVYGHADTTETMGAHHSSELLAAARAQAVYRALLARSVPASRMETNAAVETSASAANAEERARNQRVEFRVLAASAPTHRDETANATRSSGGGAALTTAPRNVNALAAVASIGAATRYDLPSAITVPDGSASMVLLVSRAIPGERLYLFAPDGNVPSSSNHPFQVARFRNQSGGLLEHGPVAIFESGTFLGQGLLDTLPAGATATIPFALERGVVVEQSATSNIEGATLRRIEHNLITVERFHAERTSYTVRNGIDHAVRVLVRHALAAGVTLESPPNGTEQVGGAALVPISIDAQSQAVQQVQARVPFSIQTHWDDPLAAEAIEAYLRDGHVAIDVAATLRTALDLRRQVADLAHERDTLDERRHDLERATDETRVNLLSIERTRGADDLRRQLMARLARNSGDIDQITRRTVEIDGRLGELRVRLAESVHGLELDATVPGAS